MAFIFFRLINLYFNLWLDCSRTNQIWAKKLDMHRLGCPNLSKATSNLAMDIADMMDSSTAGVFCMVHVWNKLFWKTRNTYLRPYHSMENCINLFNTKAVGLIIRKKLCHKLETKTSQILQWINQPRLHLGKKTKQKFQSSTTLAEQPLLALKLNPAIDWPHPDTSFAETSVLSCNLLMVAIYISELT